MNLLIYAPKCLKQSGFQAKKYCLIGLSRIQLYVVSVNLTKTFNILPYLITLNNFIKITSFKLRQRSPMTTIN